jgi:hypothetical protein
VRTAPAAAALALGSALLAASAAPAAAWVGGDSCPTNSCDNGNGPSLDGLRAGSHAAGGTEMTGTLRLREVAAPSPAREAEGPAARRVEHPPR